jgi:hypothetical protein
MSTRRRVHGMGHVTDNSSKPASDAQRVTELVERSARAESGWIVRADR